MLLRIVAAGDTDDNGEVNSSDFFAILCAAKFNNPAAGAATWGEGDFNGDTLVNSTDLFTIQYNQEPYATTAATLLATLPEPSSFALAALGLVGLLAVARRGRAKNVG